MTERERIISRYGGPARSILCTKALFLPMLGRDPPALGFLGQMPEPVFDIRDEPLSSDQISKQFELTINSCRTFLLIFFFAPGLTRIRYGGLAVPRLIIAPARCESPVAVGGGR